MALRAERLKDKVVLDQVTSEFVDDVIQIIHGTFDSSLSATTKKRKSNETVNQVDLACANEIAVLS